ncbi:hypothetical protein A2W14_04990 [Candidatus Gottesmanbacteria bacterium RBG_16_37_8]|uniref:Glycosyltransferase RgtA/B/C/D-like domain-containing protein n=1 Tax=Candidatus Gottesmanbacteria bacterium RBG_16_37_8 TaxID=1798371 RepID=A0A1F5YV75_9BACT|nr:MAG: hypothetical protein A2W14_04990 [Candidatus Gottesmanbacteria bacterium RBG_16_37_8]
MFVFQRLTTAAHHYILGSFFSLASIYYLAKSFEKRSIIDLLLASISGFLTAFIFVPAILLVYISIPVFLILFLTRVSYKLNKNKYRRIFISLLIFISLSIVPIIYLRYVAQFPEFKAFINTEQIAPYDIRPSNYLMIVGMTYLFSFFSIRRILAKGKSLELLLFSYLIIHPAAVFLATKVLEINKVRFFFTSYFIVFGVLATFGIIEIAEFIKRRWNKIPTVLILGILLFIILYPSRHNFGMSYARNRVCFCQKEFFDYGYPQKEVMETINYLKKESGEYDAVLSGYFAGVLIPAFSGNRVYTSWWQRLMQTDNLGVVSENVERFYSRRMQNEEALSFLRKEGIKFVFLGDEERNKSADRKDLNYPFLTEKSRFGTTILYRVEEGI